MININKSNQEVCNACGFAYDENYVKEIEVKTDHFEPDEYYLEPVHIKFHLCINCIRDLRKQTNSTFYKRIKDKRAYERRVLSSIK